MTPLIPAAGGALIAAGVLGAVLGSRRTTPPPPAPTRPRLHTRGVSQRTRLLLAGGAGVGILIAMLTGWVLAIILLPAVVVGLPILLAKPATAARIIKLEAMEQWTRSLAGVLTVGAGLEQALIATLRSTPDPIRPEVTQLVARLRARWATEAALRAFADQINDATGDLVAANLILAARRRGAGLADVLQALAESVAADVAARRAIEADRDKPRGTARNVTLISATALVVLALTGSYVAPFGTPIGQVLLTVLLTAYAATLIWMRRMTIAPPLPRFISTTTRPGAPA